MKAYKGFNKDLTCRKFQYKEGKSYEEKQAELCNKGFHACENPIDCLKYYSPNHSVYHAVELDKVSDKREPGDTKVVAKKITIGAKIGIPQICQLTFEYVKAHCNNENNAEPGKPATAGNYGAATAGDSGAATSRGSSSVGNNGLAVARGNNVKVKGGLGAILVIAEENDYNNDVKEWKAVVVDGETIKADTWYKLVDGKLIEAE